MAPTKGTSYKANVRSIINTPTKGVNPQELTMSDYERRQFEESQRRQRQDWQRQQEQQRRASAEQHERNVRRSDQINQWNRARDEERNAQTERQIAKQQREFNEQRERNRLNKQMMGAAPSGVPLNQPIKPAPEKPKYGWLKWWIFGVAVITVIYMYQGNQFLGSLLGAIAVFSLIQFVFYVIRSICISFKRAVARLFGR
jgi:cation transport ATPase